ncbi:MAG: PAS domain-containing protein [Flavobacteriaceae bacterium]|nr:PAS domain-containing protein [Flavobacteriaceae bacterium]
MSIIGVCLFILLLFSVVFSTSIGKSHLPKMALLDNVRLELTLAYLNFKDRIDNDLKGIRTAKGNNHLNNVQIDLNNFLKNNNWHDKIIPYNNKQNIQSIVNILKRVQILKNLENQPLSKTVLLQYKTGFNPLLKRLSHLNKNLLHQANVFFTIQFILLTIFLLYVVFALIILKKYSKKKLLLFDKQQQLVEQLKENNYLLNEMQKIGKIGYYNYNFDTNTFKGSQYILNLLGLAEEKLNLNAWIKCIHPDDRTILTSVLKKRRADSSVPLDVEYRIIKPENGEILWIHHMAKTPQKDKKGKLLNVLGTIQDITQKKEAALKINRFSQIMASALNEIFIVNFKTSAIIDINNSVVSNLEYPREDILNLGIQNFAPEVTQKKLRSLSKILTHQKTVVFETFQKRKNGTTYPVEMHIQKGEHIEVDTFLIIAIDISERKKAQKLLNETQERWQFALEGTTDGIWDIDFQNNTVFYSKRWKSMLGYQEHEIGNTLKAWRELVHPDDLEYVDNAYLLHKNKKTKYYNAEYRMLCKDGSYKWILDRGEILARDTDGTPLRMIGTQSDISKRKLTEISLKAHEIELQKAQEIALLGSYNLNLITQKAVVSKTFNHITEIKAAPQIDFTKDWQAIVHPDDMAGNQKMLSYCIKTGEKFNREYRIIAKKSKTIKWVHGLGEIVFKEGVAIGFVGTIQDITQQKIAEQTLIKNKLKLQEAQEITQLGTFVFDDSTDTFETSQIFDAVMGIGSSYKKDLQGWIDLVHPEDYSQAQELLDDSSLESISTEFRIIRPKDKKTIWILGHAKKEYDDKRIRTRITGTIQEITERKLNEERIKQSDIILNQIDSLIQVVDKKGNVTYTSPSVKTLLGYDPKEMLGQGWWLNTTSSPEEANRVRNAVLDNILNSTSLTDDLVHRKIKTKDGKEKLFQWISSKGIGDSLIFIGVDVTQRYHEEQTKEIIYNITRKANETASIEALFNFIKSELGKLINTSNFFIALYDKITGMVSTPYMVDEEDDDSDFPKGKTLTGYVIDSKKSLLANEAVFKKLERANKIERFGPSSKCWLGVPLIINNEVIGAIVIQSYTDEKAYTKKDVVLLELIASNISQVIKQTRDYKQIKLLNQALIQSPEAVIVTNVKGEIEYANPAFTALSGYSIKEAIGKTPRILKSGEQTPKVYEDLWKTITSGKVWKGELINQHKKGTHYLVDANIAPVKDKKGNITHFIAVEADITDKRKLEHDFIHAFIDAQEQEKQSFGEDLHDGISQILAAEAMYIDVLMRLDKKDDKKITGFLSKIRELNLKATNDARNIAHGLMSKQLKEDGLLKAINHICIDYSHSRNIDFTFEHTNLKEADFSREIKTNIFRIIQEISTNTIRHSLAKKSAIVMRKIDKDSLKLVVKDDGVGIDFDKMKRDNKGAGLKNIERRVTLLNGKSTLKSAHNKGTCYTIIVPLNTVR